MLTSLRNPPWLPFRKGGCEKIEIGDKNDSPVVQGTGKFAPPKSAAKRKLLRGHSPGFRKQTIAALSKLIRIHKDLPDGACEVEPTPGNEKTSASFWQANFPGPWT
jgi:hypothetical protein